MRKKLARMKEDLQSFWETEIDSHKGRRISVQCSSANSDDQAELWCSEREASRAFEPKLAVILVKLQLRRKEKITIQS